MITQNTDRMTDKELVVFYIESGTLEFINTLFDDNYLAKDSNGFELLEDLNSKYDDWLEDKDCYWSETEEFSDMISQLFDCLGIDEELFLAYSIQYENERR